MARQSRIRTGWDEGNNSRIAENRASFLEIIGQVFGFNHCVIEPTSPIGCGCTEGCKAEPEFESMKEMEVAVRRAKMLQ